jgi:hypothetical protein
VRQVHVALALEDADVDGEQARQPAMVLLQLRRGRAGRPPGGREGSGPAPAGRRGGGVGQLHEQASGVVVHDLPPLLLLEPGRGLLVEELDPTPLRRQSLGGGATGRRHPGAEGLRLLRERLGRAAQQLVDLRGQAPHRRERGHVLGRVRGGRVVHEQHHPAVRVLLQSGRQKGLPDHREVLAVRRDQDGQQPRIGVRPEQLLLVGDPGAGQLRPAPVVPPARVEVDQAAGDQAERAQVDHDAEQDLPPPPVGHLPREGPCHADDDGGRDDAGHDEGHCGPPQLAPGPDGGPVELRPVR